MGDAINRHVIINIPHYVCIKQLAFILFLNKYLFLRFLHNVHSAANALSRRKRNDLITTQKLLRIQSNFYPGYFTSQSILYYSPGNLVIGALKSM